MSFHHLLKTSPIFALLDEDDLKQLESFFVPRRYTRGQVIFHMGDDGGSLYFIRKGRVKVTIPSPEGDEVILVILSAGEILGELSLIDGRPRSATVQAMEETEALCLRREDFVGLMRSRFGVALRMLEVLSQRLRDTDVMLAETHFLDINTRLAKKLLDLNKVFGVKEEGGVRIGVRITQKDLASMVGATRESVNKQLRLLREQDIVNLSGGYIRIIDPMRLARRAHIEEWEIVHEGPRSS